MAFETKRRLAFGDADPSGAAYFPSYLHLLVGVVEEFFAEIGWPWADLERDHGLILPTARIEVHFLRPGFPRDALDFRLKVAKVSATLLELRHEVRRGEDLLWAAEQTLVPASVETRRGAAWPEGLRLALERTRTA
ncbi:thioesterase family protein [Neomegalonema sp.]|uniref:acyl-CoA thioesterase n=1 Tax=Neomegalonema sp. TaxID=2039713 RepID=UPI0026035356|nr:thioesterase family protein [Neomegalonema sp.]MDD2868588.1 thioesterase family protein [Neomegalonema sp.]